MHHVDVAAVSDTTGSAQSPAADAPDAAGASLDPREAVAERYGRIAYVLALHMTGRPEDARDIAQEAMLRLFRHASGLRDRENPRAWLLTTVRNLTRDLWRRQRVRSDGAIDPETIAGELLAGGSGPEETFERREVRARVWRAIALLPGGKREILVLRDFHDLSYAEIARVLGIPAGTVMSRLHAARTALRAALKEGMTRA
jgi:RNA polymerase sigma-70 factor (ECF subfamily)